jgi:hypothetical protein
MSVIDFVKHHPGEAAIGAAAVVAVIFVAYSYIKAPAASSGGTVVSSGPDDAQVSAEEQLAGQQQQIQGQLATQSNQLSLQQEQDAAAVTEQNLSAQVQTYTVQQQAAVSLAGVAATQEVTDTQTQGQLAAIEAQVQAQTDQDNIAANASISTTALNDSTQAQLEDAIQAGAVDTAQINANVAQSQIAAGVQQTSILGQVYAAIAGQNDSTQLGVANINAQASIANADLSSATEQAALNLNAQTQDYTTGVMANAGAYTPVQPASNNNSSITSSLGSVAGLAALALL